MACMRIRSITPTKCLAEAQSWREKMVAAAAEANETLTEAWLEQGDLSEQQVTASVRSPHPASAVPLYF
jgi:elongation factor G